MKTTTIRELIRQSRIRLVLLLSGGIVLVAIGLFAWLWKPQPDVHTLRVTAGVPGLNRYGIARYFQRHAKEVELKVHIVESEGTIGATRMVDSGEVDMAIVNGLLRSPQLKSVRQVSPVTVEAIHLLVKQEFAESVAEDFNALQGLSLNVGPVGTETEMLSHALLAFCDVSIDDHRSNDGPKLTRQSIGDLLTTLEKIEDAKPTDIETLRKTLPDVVIHASTYPSPLAKRLIQIGDFQLIAAPFADAFSKITVEEEEHDSDHLDQIHVMPIEIPAYMYGATPPTPREDCPTIGCPTILIAHKDVPDAVVSRLLPRIYDGPVKRVYDPPPLHSVAPTYPWHPASIEYRDRDKPVVFADLAEAVQKIVGVIAPLVGGCLALFGFYRWRQTLRFIEYFEQYQTLDRQAKGLTQNEVVTPTAADEARRLEAQLTKLQEQAVADFCHNYFYADGVFRNFIQLLAETRSFLRASTRRVESTSASHSNDEESER